MLDLMKALNDPEFMSTLSAMPQQIVDKLNRIDSKLDVVILLLTDPSYKNSEYLQSIVAANLQNSISANLQNGLTETPAPANVNPVDPDSYK